MNSTTFRLDRMNSAYEFVKGFPGDETVQRNQLALIIHHAQMAHIPVLDWLLEKVAAQHVEQKPAALLSHDINCAQCGQSFKSIAALNGHQRVHKKGGAHE